MLFVQLIALRLVGGGRVPVGDAAGLGVGLIAFTILYEPVPALLELLRTSILCKALGMPGLVGRLVWVLIKRVHVCK